MMENLDFSIVAPYQSILLTGLYWTLLLAITSAFFSFVLGISFALIVLYAPKLIKIPVEGFMWLFMGTPLLLQLFLIYYGLVQIGIDIPALGSGIIGLSLHFAVYNADILRAGIVAIDPGQVEGSRSIGFGRYQSIRYIVLPQAIRNTLPAMGNNMIFLLKDTSLVSVIGIAELVHGAQLAISETYSPFEFYIAVAAIYYLLNLMIILGLKFLEIRVEASR
ncbi:L-cystine transport system permease protein YecS [Pseudochrobactrum sp. MP213Fo]